MNHHLVRCPKYRKPVMIGEVETRFKQLIHEGRAAGLRDHQPWDYARPRASVRQGEPDVGSEQDSRRAQRFYIENVSERVQAPDDFRHSGRGATSSRCMVMSLPRWSRSKSRSRSTFDSHLQGQARERPLGRTSQDQTSSGVRAGDQDPFFKGLESVRVEERFANQILRKFKQVNEIWALVCSEVARGCIPFPSSPPTRIDVKSW